MAGPRCASGCGSFCPLTKGGGYILRTLAETASEEELRADLAYLRHLWQTIHERSAGAEAPKLLYQDLSLAQRVLRDMVNVETTRVLVDSRENFQKLAAFSERYMPQVRARSSTIAASARSSICTT